MFRYIASRVVAAPLVVVLLHAFPPGVRAEVICRYCAEGHAAATWGIDLDEGKYRYAPDRQVDVQHIKLDVTPNFDQQTVAGTAFITAAPIAQPVDTLRLDAVDLKIQAVRCQGASVDDFVSSRKDLRISFAQPVPPGTKITLEIDYQAEPTRGLYFRTPEMGYLDSDTHVWTQGEAHEARFWFPCFDYPNERSSSEIVCHVPADMTVVSNGKLIGEQLTGDGLKSVHWLQEKPHVNYLICLVAGHFTKLEKLHRDVPLGFYVQPTLAEHAHNSFRDTPDIMAFLEAEIGVPYPWNKYDQVTIRDFVAGGMENTTITTLTHRTIFAEATENLRTTRRLDAHEMTHQWFGDYVTCKDWSHLWLNEGFATYYTHLFEGHKFGRDAMLYGLYQDAKRSILPRKNDTKPIVYKEYENASEQFDYRAYPKASWVLHMLRSQLGADLYRKAIRAYLEKHALQSVVSDDLRQILEEHSGLTLDRFFDQWIYHARHPDLKIRYHWLPKQKLAQVTIRQTQEVNDDVLLFHLPTKLRFTVDGKIVDHDIEIHQAEHDYFVPLPAQPSIVRFDPDYTVLADVSFEKSDELLKAQLENEGDMIGRLLACEALADRKTHAAVELLATTLATDPFFGVRIAAAEALEKHDSDEAHDALRNHRRQADARVRARVVEALVKRFHAETPDLIKAVLAEERNPAIQAAAIRALGRFHGEVSRNLIAEFLSSESFRNELADAAIAAIRQQNDAAYMQPLRDVLRQREDRFTTRGFGQGLMALAHVSRDGDEKDDVREFLASYVNHPKQGVRVAAIRGLGALGDPKAIPIVESFSEANDDRISKPAQDALRELRENKPVTPQELVELREQMAEIEKSREQLQDDLQELKEQLQALRTEQNEQE